MAELSIKLKERKDDKCVKYKTKLPAEDYKRISLALDDLNRMGLPIDKAVKDFKHKKSDWDIALGKI